MSMQTEHPITVHRRRERDGVPLNDRLLRQSVLSGMYRRVVAGSYVRETAWKNLKPIQQHLVRVLEVADRARGPIVLTHSAAAAIHTIDRIGAWPNLVDVRIAQSGGGRSSGAVRRRALGFEGVELVEWRGHLVTSPAQTVVDLASEATFTAGVVAADQVLWEHRSGGPLARHDELLGAFDTNRRRGVGRVPAVLEFSTELSDSVRESEARVLLDRLGFPRPELQKEFVLPGGRTVRSDFYFPEQDHVGEFDGVGKYFDPDILAGRTPEQALLEEKDRGDALRRQVSGLSRWRTPDQRDPARLYSILVADGLPSRFPPPRKRA
ncbi:hypothetical protein LG322_05915 [Microbacterium aerolatum]|uniref:hypothetical protein n=1 Tax=Microbacterium aerolatum TaxID=153731 RepID=UPI00384ED6CB